VKSGLDNPPPAYRRGAPPDQLTELRARREAQRAIDLAAVAVARWAAGDTPLDEVLDLIQRAGLDALHAQLPYWWDWFGECAALPGPRSA